MKRQLHWISSPIIPHIYCVSLICIFISSPVQIYVYIVDILYMQTVLKSCYCYELENWKKTLKKKK